MDTQPQTTTIQTSPTKQSFDNYEDAIKSCQSYSTSEQEILIWFCEYARTNSMSLSDLGKAIGFSGTVVQRVLAAAYGARPNAIMTAIYRYRSLVEARNEIGGIASYVHTSMAKRIWQAADYARIRQQVVSLIGATQRGKTTAIKEYAKDKGSTVLIVRCPVAPTPAKIVRRIVKHLGCTGSCSMDSNMDLISRSITPQHLIVIDEIHQVILQDRAQGIRTVETLREIADECDCGMLLIGTKIWCDALNRDAEWKGILEQIAKRGMTVVLKDTLPLDDLRQLWEHYLLSEPNEDSLSIVKTIAKQEGLGRYTKILSIGYTISAKQNQPYSWDHFLRANATLNALAEGN